MRRLALVTMAVFLLIGAYAIAKVLHHPRDAITAVATPAPLHDMTPITLKPGQKACENAVALSPDTRVVRIYSGSPTPTVPQLRLTLRGDGYAADVRSPGGVGPGTGSDGIYDTRIPAPTHSALVTVCVRTATAGAGDAMLAGSREDRVRSRSITTVDGRRSETKLGMILLAGGSVSTLSHPKQVLQRAAAFDPPFVGWFSLALLGLVTVLGVPALAVWAVLRALADDGAARAAE
jgi:hypothetical protein